MENISDSPKFIVSLLCLFIIVLFPIHFGMDSVVVKVYVAVAVIVQSLILCSAMDRIRGK